MIHTIQQHYIQLGIIVLLLFTFCCLNAQNWQETKALADKAYQDGNFTQSITYYQKALTEEAAKSSPEILYNLGNAYYKNKELGAAILYWERALRLSPNKDIRRNLRIAKEEVKGDIYPVKPFFLVEIWKAIRSTLSANMWAIVGLFILWIGVALIMSRMYRHQPRWGYGVGVGLMVLSVFPFIWASTQSALAADSGRGVLMVEQTTLRSAPDGTGDFMIYEGTALELLDQVGDWTEVRLRNSDVGWVRTDEYEKI